MSCHQLSLSFSSGQFLHCSIRVQIAFWCSFVESEDYVLYCCCFSSRNDYSFPWNSLRSFAISMHSHYIWKLKEDMQMIRIVPTAQKRSQNSVSSGTWEHMINENFLHWERLLQSLASKTSRLYAPEPYYELRAKQTGKVGFRVSYACTSLAYWTAQLPAFFLFTFLHQYIHIQKQKLGSIVCSVDQILRKQHSLQPLRGIAWVNTGELVPVDITLRKNWRKQGLGVNLLPLMDLHLHIPLCLTYQRKFSLCKQLRSTGGNAVFWAAQDTSCTQAEPADFNWTPHTAASESSGFCAYEYKTACYDPDGINRVFALFLIVRSSFFNSSKDDLQTKSLGVKAVVLFVQQLAQQDPRPQMASKATSILSC